MDLEIIHAVMNEILGDLKRSSEESKALQQSLQELNGTIAGFGQRLTDLQGSIAEKLQVSADRDAASPAGVSSPAPDPEALKALQVSFSKGVDGMNVSIADHTAQLTELLRKEFDRVHDTLSSAPRPTVRQWRLVLFPENDYHGHFKFFVSRFFLWVLGIIIVVGAAMLIRRAILEHYRLESLHPEVSSQAPPGTGLSFRSESNPAHPAHASHHRARPALIEQAPQWDSSGQGRGTLPDTDTSKVGPPQ